MPVSKLKTSKKSHSEKNACHFSMILIAVKSTIWRKKHLIPAQSCPFGAPDFQLINIPALGGIGRFARGVLLFCQRPQGT